jgi:hypothetical protein
MSRAALFAALALVSAGIAGATPTWTSPQPLTSGGIALAPEVALNGFGGAVAVWDRETGPDCATSPASLTCIHTVETAYRSQSGAAWNSGHAIARPGVGARPQAAVNAGGDAALLWVHDIGRDRVVQATLRRGSTGEFPNPNDLSDSVLEVRSHHIALDDAGDAVAVWAQRPVDRFEVHAEIRRASLGYWGVATLLSHGEVNGGPALAVTPAGDAFVVWIENGVVESVHGNISSATWDAPVALTSAADAEGDPVLAVNDSGDAVTGWQWRDQPKDPTIVQASFRPAHGSWGPVANLATVGRDFAQAPQVGVDAAGNAIALWTDDGGLRSDARLTTTGTWSKPIALTKAVVSDPQLAVDARGDAAAVWIDAATQSVDAAVRVAGAWQPAVLVTSAQSSNPRVAIDGAGNGIALWNAPSGSEVDVQTADLAGDWQPTLVNARRPAVRGIPRVGRTVVCDRGAWEGTVPISFAYQWRRSGANLRGATRRTYRIRQRDAGMRLGCRVTATNPARTLAVASRPVRVRPLK